MVKIEKPVRGTREWAVANIDCCTGCPHDCRYCYARYDAVERRKQISAEEWRRPVVRDNDVYRDQPLYPGQVMFPTTHDIVPEILEACLTVIRNLLASGNRVLLVSKPHLDCIKRICEEFSLEKEQLLFRFTITARDEGVLKFWEPGAPGYGERRECLCYAFANGFNTSVSIEPILDMGDVADMVKELQDCVTHSIWLGKMNKIEKRVKAETKEEKMHIARIISNQTDEKIMEVYEKLRHEPLVRWKESVKTVVGIDLADLPGQDI